MMDFLHTAVVHFNDERRLAGSVHPGLISISPALQEYTANPAAKWPSKDAAIYLVTSLTVEGSVQAVWCPEGAITMRHVAGVNSVNALGKPTLHCISVTVAEGGASTCRWSIVFCPVRHACRAYDALMVDRAASKYRLTTQDTLGRNR
jgi:hypothetical protein